MSHCTNSTVSYIYVKKLLTLSKLVSILGFIYLCAHNCFIWIWMWMLIADLAHPDTRVKSIRIRHWSQAFGVPEMTHQQL